MTTSPSRINLPAVAMVSAWTGVLVVLSFWMSRQAYHGLPVQASTAAPLVDGLFSFETALANYISGQTGATVTWRGYYNMDNLRYEILRQLDASHPMIIHLPGMGHYAMVIGYRDQGNTLIIQDSNGVAPSAAQPNPLVAVLTKNGPDIKAVVDKIGADNIVALFPEFAKCAETYAAAQPKA